MTVAVSLTAPQFDGRFDPVVDAASTAEAFGFDGIFLLDHLVPLDDASRPVLELAATLGAVAASTTRISVGSLVMRVPLRGPAVSVAIAATAAAIAPGRVILGLGSGDALSANEAERFGQILKPLDSRVAEVAEAIASTSQLGISRWVGGLHDRLLDVAVHADGWNAWAIEPERLHRIADRLTVERPDLTVSWGGSVVMGRNHAHLDDLLEERHGKGGTITGTADEVRRHLEAIVAAGATHLVLSLLPNRPDSWEAFAELVLPKVAGR